MDMKPEKSESLMTREKAIMELLSNTMQEETLECCVKILESYPELADLTGALIKRKEEIEKKNEDIFEIATGGEFDIDKMLGEK